MKHIKLFENKLWASMDTRNIPNNVIELNNIEITSIMEYFYSLDLMSWSEFIFKKGTWGCLDWGRWNSNVNFVKNKKLKLSLVILKDNDDYFYLIFTTDMYDTNQGHYTDIDSYKCDTMDGVIELLNNKYSVPKITNKNIINRRVYDMKIKMFLEETTDNNMLKKIVDIIEKK